MRRDVEISRSVLSDRVKDHLLQAILAGQYSPGARIVETRVASELGTSQAPVREALRDLEALGVVETTAFRGARVRRPSAAELLEAFAVRAELESLAARLAVARVTDDDLAELDRLLVEMRRAAEVGDGHAEAIADAAFHGLIVDLSGNSTLRRVWRTLEPFSRTYITIGAPGADRRWIAEQHAPVLTALRARDPELVTAVLHDHFEQAAAGLARHWPDEPMFDGGPAPAHVASVGAPDATTPAERTP
jgi:DNA-binding GntR family transcriptional regulator